MLLLIVLLIQRYMGLLLSASNAPSTHSLLLSLGARDSEYLDRNGYSQACTGLDRECVSCSDSRIEGETILQNGDFSNLPVDLELFSSVLPGGWYSPSLYFSVDSSGERTEVYLSGTLAGPADICQIIETVPDQSYLINFELQFTYSNDHSLLFLWDATEIRIRYTGEELNTYTPYEYTLLAHSARTVLCLKKYYENDHYRSPGISHIQVFLYSPSSCDECEAGYRLSKDRTCTETVSGCISYNNQGDCEECNFGYNLAGALNHCFLTSST